MREEGQGEKSQAVEIQRIVSGKKWRNPNEVVTDPETEVIMRMSKKAVVKCMSDEVLQYLFVK